MAKRIFDFIASLLCLISLGWLIVILTVLAGINTGSSGVFCQNRIGRYGAVFKIFKIRTMHIQTDNISSYGKFLRKFKLDELPQLINILKGDMSFVGPRPDIPGYYDLLEGEHRKILSLRPGLCSRAALKYINEEEILATKSNPIEYNDTVIFPDKVLLNLEYAKNQSFAEDLSIICATFRNLIIKI